MYWKVKPLAGKYYGTVVENTDTGAEFRLWLGMETDDYAPSERELANGWDKELGYDHVELQKCYIAACIYADSLNQEELG